MSHKRILGSDNVIPLGVKFTEVSDVRRAEPEVIVWIDVRSALTRVRIVGQICPAPLVRNGVDRPTGSRSGECHLPPNGGMFGWWTMMWSSLAWSRLTVGAMIRTATAPHATGEGMPLRFPFTALQNQSHAVFTR